MPNQASAQAIAMHPPRHKGVDPALLERLAETGFLATEFGMDEHAERIFLCLERLRPGHPSPLIALAMVQARRGRMEQAIAQMHRTLAEHADCDMARAVLGTMLVHMRQPGALQLFEEVLASGADPGAASVASCYIDTARELEAQASASQPESLEFFRHYNLRA